MTLEGPKRHLPQMWECGTKGPRREGCRASILHPAELHGAVDRRSVRIALGGALAAPLKRIFQPVLRPYGWRRPGDGARLTALHPLPLAHQPRWQLGVDVLEHCLGPRPRERADRLVSRRDGGGHLGGHRRLPLR